MRIEPRGKYKYVRRGAERFMQEHRFIMHKLDPRENESELDVHHIDGDKANNDPSNLMWLTHSEHMRLHHTGENHFPCSGVDNANYKHGMCVGGVVTKEYKRVSNKKSYEKHRESRLAKQNAYSAEHREHKRWYDKIRYWERKLLSAETEERRAECSTKIKELKEYAI